MVSVSSIKNNLSKLKLYAVPVNGHEVKVFDKIPLKNAKIKDLFMRVEHEGGEHFNIILESPNIAGAIGKEQISINPPYDRVWGSLTEVVEKFRSSKSPKGKIKGARLGEAMRLGTIIETLENGMKAMDIYAMPQAVFFHAKYGFVPKITSYKADLMKTLENIASRKNPKLRVCSQRAKAVIEKVKKQKTGMCVSDSIANETSKIAKDYIDTVIKEKLPFKRYTFKKDIDMVLTREAIIKNKKFYNALFERHGIDYRI